VSNKESKTSYKLKQLYKGYTLKVGVVSIKPEVGSETPDFPEGWFFAENEYKSGQFGGSVGVRSNGEKNLVDLTASVAYQNLAVGGKATLDTASKAPPNDWNFGVEYSGTGYVATVQTEAKRTKLNASYYQNVTRKYAIGATATVGLTKPTRALQVGVDYNIDIDTTARSYLKVDSSKDNSTVGLAIEHRLGDPNVLIGVASEWNVAPASTSVGKFGFSLTFGDF